RIDRGASAGDSRRPARRSFAPRRRPRPAGATCFAAMSRAPLGPLGTLAALLAARRAVPLALVLAAAMTAEWLEARSPAWVAIDVALFAVFCLVVPYAWRRACTGRAGLA